MSPPARSATGLYADAAKPQHGTVQRLLQRLAAKGFVVRDRSLGLTRSVPTDWLRSSN